MSRRDRFIAEVGGLLLAAALAPSSAACAEAAAANGTTVSEVIVTAQKRSQNVQNVGTAITVASGEDLATHRVQQALDFASISSSLSSLGESNIEA